MASEGSVRELGGVHGINCKSGKDRTAMEIAISFTQVWGLGDIGKGWEG